MPGRINPAELRRAPSALWLMVLFSLGLHAAIVGVLLVLAGVTGTDQEPESEKPKRTVSLHPASLPSFTLPPLRGNRDAGPGGGAGPTITKPKSSTAKKEQKKAEPKSKEPQKRNTTPEKTQPKPTKKRSDSPKTQKKTESATEPEKDKPSEAVAEVSTGSLARKDAAAEPKPVSEIERRDMRGSRYSESSSRRVAGGKVTNQISVEEGGGGGTPEMFRTILVSRVWEAWRPSPLGLGEVREALVEFTLYSPPVPKGSKQNRPASEVRDIKIIESSGDYEFDLEARRTLERLTNLPPLPDYIKDAEKVVACLFSYRGERESKQR